ncbi:hypothetical protein BDB13_6225 [Rhodococcus sp. OK302]|nr:hypothetical protein BDB13_6225 [Rhodococcus sp. OK302]
MPPPSHGLVATTHTGNTRATRGQVYSTRMVSIWPVNGNGARSA